MSVGRSAPKSACASRFCRNQRQAPTTAMTTARAKLPRAYASSQGAKASPTATSPAPRRPKTPAPKRNATTSGRPGGLARGADDATPAEGASSRAAAWDDGVQPGAPVENAACSWRSLASFGPTGDPPSLMALSLPPILPTRKDITDPGPEAASSSALWPLGACRRINGRLEPAALLALGSGPAVLWSLGSGRARARRSRAPHRKVSTSRPMSPSTSSAARTPW